VIRRSMSPELTQRFNEPGSPIPRRRD
jgi:hypothetical protein